MADWADSAENKHKRIFVLVSAALSHAHGGQGLHVHGCAIVSSRTFAQVHIQSPNLPLTSSSEIIRKHCSVCTHHRIPTCTGGRLNRHRHVLDDGTMEQEKLLSPRYLSERTLEMRESDSHGIFCTDQRVSKFMTLRIQQSEI